MLLAKQSLMDDLDMYELQAGCQGEKLTQVEELRLELFEESRPQRAGASARKAWVPTTVLDVKIAMYPTHAAISQWP